MVNQDENQPVRIVVGIVPITVMIDVNISYLFGFRMDIDVCEAESREESLRTLLPQCNVKVKLFD